MNYKLNILKNGFTLIEMLISLIIVSSITILTFVVFLQIENIDYLETNKIEISNYSNNILNNISSELRRSNTLTYFETINIRRITTQYSNIIVNLSSGVTKNDSVLYNFYPNDELGRKKYEIQDFEVSPVRVKIGDILSEEGHDAREASRNISMNILLFTRENQITPYDTLFFNRRVFCPALLISNNS